MERCVCCERPLSPVARFGTWCDNCTRGVWKDAEMLRTCADDTVLSWLLERGCVTIARYVMGAIPFSDELT